ncbi:hypothetical protein VIGAN_08298600 [Vigna angularis var. angularis]|uniref:Trichome birefringence-like C-terminal domain-containing protein n=1 Tax=Vigna angularis var. angularis TaxID=157739 RepID=A0A0S3STD9_PHAAN|nr:hypothetical protein VIGAN_08298600 [Vigna angularis var. angularis]
MKTVPFLIQDSGATKTDAKMKAFANGDGNLMTVIFPDGHPSKFREPGTPPNAPQDCSHWCLPGVPDTWNELLYAQLLSEKFGMNKKFPERG